MKNRPLLLKTHTKDIISMCNPYSLFVTQCYKKGYAKRTQIVQSVKAPVTTGILEF